MDPTVRANKRVWHSVRRREALTRLRPQTQESTILSSIAWLCKQLKHRLRAGGDDAPGEVTVEGSVCVAATAKSQRAQRDITWDGV